MFWKIGRNSGELRGLPRTLVKIWIPFAPRSPIARSASRTQASTLFIGIEAMNAGKRSGCLRHSSASPSFAMRASSGVLSEGPSISIGGLASESTCCRPSNSSIIRRRASTSQSVGSSGNADSATCPGTRLASRSKMLFGMKWLKTSMIMGSVHGDVHLADRAGPLGNVRLEERSEFLGRARGELDALASRSLPEFCDAQDAHGLDVQLRDDVLRRSRGRDQPVPGVDVDRVAELGHGRD